MSSGDVAARRGHGLHWDPVCGAGWTCARCWVHPECCGGAGGHLCGQQGGGRCRQQQQCCSRGSALTMKMTLRLLSSSMSWGTPVLAQRIT